MSVLPRTAGLLLVLVVKLDFARRHFAIGHAGITDDALDAVFAFDAFDVNVEVQLAHAGDQRLAGFFVGQHSERRVFAAEAFERLTEFVRAFAFDRFDAQADHGVRNEDALQRVRHF